MRIALVCPYDWQAVGGVQVHVGELAEHLRVRGHEVVVLAPGRRGGAGVRIVAAPTPVRYNRSVAPLALSPVQLRRVRSVLRSFEPDVVHVHEPLVPSTSMYATMVARAPVVATFHAFGERSRLFDVAAPLLRRVADRIGTRVAVSEAAAMFAASRVGGTFEIVPNGVDIARFRGATPLGDLPEGKNVLFVGRLEPRKGLGVLLEALRLAEVPWRLLIAGDGPGRDLIASLPGALASRVTGLGAVPRETLPSCYASAEVFAAPSLGGESFGMVITEAMASGLAVVASDIPGYRDVVGNAGLLVPAGDARGLAAGIDRVVADSGLADTLRKAARARAEDFSWDGVTSRLEEIYRASSAAGARG